ncbi:MAG: hypothetical protein NT118_14690, partial [Lentisphaerae bacterium]|nr:hypothetical protein [Lentisphaerota bacterium]
MNIKIIPAPQIIEHRDGVCRFPANKVKVCCSGLDNLEVSNSLKHLVKVGRELEMINDRESADLLLIGSFTGGKGTIPEKHIEESYYLTISKSQVCI